METIIALAWSLSCLLVVCLGVAHFILYYMDMKWRHDEYIWEYLDKKYDLILVEKRDDE